MDPARPAATDQLYSAFGSYPLKPRLAACSCGCVPPQAEAALHLHPLAQMGWPEFETYLFKAMTTIGDVDDFKHFLPRLFELYLLQPELAPCGVDVLFDKLVYAGWPTWPASEAAAVRRFVACWQSTLAASVRDSERDPFYLEDLQSALKKAGFASPAI